MKICFSLGVKLYIARVTSCSWHRGMSRKHMITGRHFICKHFIAVFAGKGSLPVPQAVHMLFRLRLVGKYEGAGFA